MSNSDERDLGEFIEEEAIVRRKVCAETGRIVEEAWYDSFRNMHNFRSPAYRKFDPKSGRVLYERWMESGEEHRWPDDGPTEVFWNLEYDRIVQECHRRSGKLHRENDRPARIWYAPENGMRVREEFWFNGQLHRENRLPAVLVHSEVHGDVIQTEFYEHGLKINPIKLYPAP